MREIIGYWESNVGMMTASGYLHASDGHVDDEVTTHYLVGRDAALCHFGECDRNCTICAEPEEFYCDGARCGFVTDNKAELTAHGYGHYCPHCMSLVGGAA